MNEILEIERAREAREKQDYNVKVAVGAFFGLIMCSPLLLILWIAIT